MTEVGLDVGGLLGAEGMQVAERDAEDFPVEEQKGSEGLVLSGGGDLFMNSEMGEEGFDFWCAHGGAVYGSGRSARTNGHRLSRCGWSIRAGGRPGGGGRRASSPALSPSS